MFVLKWVIRDDEGLVDNWMEFHEYADAESVYEELMMSIMLENISIEEI